MRLTNPHKGHCLRRAANRSILVFAFFLVVSSVLLLFPGTALAMPSIYASILPSGQVGDDYSATLLAVYTGTPVWTIQSGSLPDGLDLDENTGEISGTPTEAGTFQFIVKLTDDTGTDTQIFSITIEAEALTFRTTSLPDAMEGDSYSEDIEVRGGESPYTFTLISGTLPSGLSLDDDGTIYGTPAKGTVGTYTFTIEATDDSSPALSGERIFILVVESGYYESSITISSGLSAGQTGVYADGKLVATLRGGQTSKLSFAVGKEPVITVASLVSHPTRSDTRFRADMDRQVVTEDSPDVTFTYTPEYFIDFETDPVGIASLGESQWYAAGDLLSTTAPAQIEGTTGTQYRFSYWLLPNGNRVIGGSLSWTVSAAGKVSATYDTYYLLTVTSPNGQVAGGGWYKAGTTAQWSVTPPEVRMSGILGFFRGKLKVASSSSTVLMDGPRTVTVNWSPDYTMPAVLIFLLVLFVAGVAFGVYRLLHPPAPKPAAQAVAPLAPAPPTIVFFEGGQKSPLETTREQLVQQFRLFLQRYEEDVKSVTKSEALLESKAIPEAQRLASPKEALACGYTSKNLLRTVVGNWRKAEERVQTQPEEEGVLISTVWARDIYNEWEISTCSQPRGHSGKHQGTTEIAYTLQNTVTEERTYGAKEKTTPPKPHFTDELPVVDVTQHHIIANNLATTPDDVVTPDEIIPPDSLS
jgi:hypothetical protein